MTSEITNLVILHSICSECHSTSVKPEDTWKLVGNDVKVVMHGTRKGKKLSSCEDYGKRETICLGGNTDNDFCE